MLPNQQEEAGSALSVGRNTRITSEPGLELDPVLSPDGRTLTYSAGPPGRTSIQLRQLANGEARMRTASFSTPRPRRENALRPSWRRGRSVESRGAARKITRNGSNDPKWSLDGRLIAFCADYELRTIAPDGSGGARTGQREERPGYAGTVLSIWSRASRTIYYQVYDRARQSSIWSIGLDRRPPRLLVRFDDPSHCSLRRESATDGQWFYFTVARDESDIWVMEIGRNR